jgi:multidrug efflux system membrane fusion protein
MGSDARSRLIIGRLGSAILALAIAVALAALAGGCGENKNQRAGAPAVPVLAADAVVADVPVTLKAIGAVEALNAVAVAARVTGQLLEVGFNEGQDVRKGALLFRIDPAPYKAALDQAQANLERDQARLASTEGDAVRYTALFEKGLVTHEEFDGIAATAAAAKATARADQAAVEAARLNLDYCDVRSPISGRTGRLLVKPGNMVTATGSTLVTVNQLVPIGVSFSLPEQRLSEIRRYSGEGTLAVRASLTSSPATGYDGRLTFIDNAIDRETGTILLKATFPNEDQALWPGQFVEVDLTLTTLTGAVVIPVAAVQSSQQGDGVYVVRPDSTAEWRAVVQGARLDDKVAITEGVRAGEKVVTDGQLRLSPGARVAIKADLAPAGRAEGRRDRQ